MGSTRRVFSKEIKIAAVRRVELGASVQDVALELQLNPNLVNRWYKESKEFGERAFTGIGTRRTETKVRNRSVNFRVDDAEFEVLERALAEAPARSLSEFVREQVMEASGQPSLAQIDAKLNKLVSATQKIISAVRRLEKS